MDYEEKKEEEEEEEEEEGEHLIPSCICKNLLMRTGQQ